jgi:hypothetical protein
MRFPVFPAASLVLAGCAMAFPRPVAPVGLRPVPDADARVWAGSTFPTSWIRIHFSWRYHDNDGNHGGVGNLVITPPDSLHLAFRPNLVGSGGDAGIVGDSAIWAEPRDQVEKLVPSYQLLWAMVGIARPPGAGWAVESNQDPKTKATAVRYTRGSDTVEYVSVRSGQPRLETRVVVGGKPLGFVQTLYNQFRHLNSSRLTVLGSPAQLDITFDSTAKQVRVDKDAWTAPHDH